jgi:4-diphosphocytidyl-2-C-methyl-D-erythritol kinase
VAKPDKRRAAFLGMAPDGHHIRMMEPGEADRLLTLGTAAGLFGRHAPALADVVPWLVRHEVFVAEADGGGPSGFAAARDATDLYWLSGLAVDPAFKGIGLRKALLAAVVARAGWFFHRAVGTAATEGADADWYRRRFLSISADDATPALAPLVRERPGIVSLAADDVSGEDRNGLERTLMIRWL